MGIGYLPFGVASAERRAGPARPARGSPSYSRFDSRDLGVVGLELSSGSHLCALARSVESPSCPRHVVAGGLPAVRQPFLRTVHAETTLVNVTSLMILLLSPWLNRSQGIRKAPLAPKSRARSVPCEDYRVLQFKNHRVRAEKPEPALHPAHPGATIRSGSSPATCRCRSARRIVGFDRLELAKDHDGRLETLEATN